MSLTETNIENENKGASRTGLYRFMMNDSTKNELILFCRKDSDESEEALTVHEEYKYPKYDIGGG